MLTVKGLCCYRGSRAVLSDVTFSLPAGSFLGIIGANGAGKTTLLKCLAGVLAYPRGEITFQGASKPAVSQQVWAKSVALLPQNFPASAGLLVEEMVLLGRIPHAAGFFEDRRDYEIAREALQAVGMGGFSRRESGSLSGGELQRVLIAKALAQEPRLLLLDEPTASLDIKHQRETMEMLKKIAAARRLTIVAAMHDINAAIANSEMMLLLREGGVSGFGAPREVISEAALRRLYDTPIAVKWENGMPLVV